jgi:pimeloyl-ACP methyl ester carboxylesterase
MTELPALLLLHGVGDDGGCLQPFVRALEIPNLMVRTPDAPAHGGRRAAPGADVNWLDMLGEATAHAEAMLAQAGAAGLVIGGHSMGSAVALSLAARRPDLVRGLWLEDPPAWDPAGDAPVDEVGLTDLTDLYEWFSGMQRGTLADAVHSARADHPHWPADEYEPWARAKLAVDAGTFATAKVWVRAGWSHFAAAVRCPTVVVAGETSRGGLLGERAGAHMAALPGWAVHRLPGTGHDVRRDDRPTSTRLLREFLLSLALG